MYHQSSGEYGQIFPRAKYKIPKGLSTSSKVARTQGQQEGDQGEEVSKKRRKKKCSKGCSKIVEMDIKSKDGGNMVEVHRSKVGR